MLPLRDSEEPFTLNEFGLLIQGIEEYKSEDVFRPIRDEVDELNLANGEMSLSDIKRIVKHVKSETS